MDAPVADKARVMLSILQNAWPATVSEMLMDTGARYTPPTTPSTMPSARRSCPHCLR